MQIVTPEQMRKIEDRSEKLGVSKLKLMENAGRALADAVDEYCRRNPGISPGEKSVVFLAGKGNNGGDCFAAADILLNRGYKVTIIIVGGLPSSEPAVEMFRRLPQDRIEIIQGLRSDSTRAAIEAAELDYMTVPGGSSSLDSIMDKEKQRMRLIKGVLMRAYVIVDGVFGTGFRGQLSREVSEIFNVRSSAYRIAVDVPSGGDCASGTASQGCFTADETITFGFLKTGMTQFPLKKYCGKITIADIGLPVKAVEAVDGERKYFRIERNHLADFPPVREPDAHKGTFGTVLVIAGSSSMRGAAAFASMGALRSGAGLVKLASVEKCIDTVSVLVPEATYTELDCDDYGFMLYDSSTVTLLSAMKTAEAIVMGCGMGVTSDTMELTRLVVENAECPIIIDADGINCIASDIDILLKKQTDIVITPHPGEMARLLGCDAAAVNGNRMLAAEKFAEQYNVTVVLKGAGTVVADSRQTAVNHTGNPGMSCGGSGDVLAGVIGSFIAQGCTVYDSACAGVYMHGLAGDAAAEKLGREAMLPRDIVDCLPDSFRILSEKKRNRA